MFKSRNNNKYYKHSIVSAVILLSVFIFFGYQFGVDAFFKTDFVGRCTVQIPMSICTNQYTCGACSLCGCGAWDQIIIAPVFGKTMDSGYYVCKMPAFQPMGTGGLMVGSISFGYCQNSMLSIYNPISCNIWSIAI